MPRRANARFVSVICCTTPVLGSPPFRGLSINRDPSGSLLRPTCYSIIQIAGLPRKGDWLKVHLSTFHHTYQKKRKIESDGSPSETLLKPILHRKFQFKRKTLEKTRSSLPPSNYALIGRMYAKEGIIEASDKPIEFPSTRPCGTVM